MNTTSVSLLERLQTPEAGEAWGRFVDLYLPLLHRWVQHFGIRGADAPDVVQEVFLVLMRRLRTFERQGEGCFRAWLRKIVFNKCRERRRQLAGDRSVGTVDLDALPGPEDPDTEQTEYERYLVNRLLHLIQHDFQPLTWRAFHEHVVLGRPVAAVASDLKTTPNVVYLAKARVLRRLREELAGLLD